MTPLFSDYRFTNPHVVALHELSQITPSPVQRTLLTAGAVGFFFLLAYLHPPFLIGALLLSCVFLLQLAFSSSEKLST